VKLDSGLDQHHLLKALSLALLDFARQKRRVVVCLDETQAMPLESLETLRLLTNLETEKRKLVQVILFGQPESTRDLRIGSIRQLRQRITFSTFGYPDARGNRALSRSPARDRRLSGDAVFAHAAVKVI